MKCGKKCTKPTSCKKEYECSPIPNTNAIANPKTMMIESLNTMIAISTFIYRNIEYNEKPMVASLSCRSCNIWMLKIYWLFFPLNSPLPLPILFLFILNPHVTTRLALTIGNIRLPVIDTYSNVRIGVTLNNRVNIA